MWLFENISNFLIAIYVARLTTYVTRSFDNLKFDPHHQIWYHTHMLFVEVSKKN